MNKANVFLLVVVSSLLTYISTATQPAATAGVAQERWEYFVGTRDYYRSNDPSESIASSSHFSCPAGEINVLYERESPGAKDKPSYKVRFEDGFTLPFEDYDSSNDTLSDSRTKCFDDFELFKILGELVSGKAGWHVFQVEPLKRRDNEDMVSHRTVWHWRRRVQ